MSVSFFIVEGCHNFVADNFSFLVTAILESVLLNTILSATNEEFSLVFIALKKGVPRLWWSSVSSQYSSHFPSSSTI